MEKTKLPTERPEPSNNFSDLLLAPSNLSQQALEFHTKALLLSQSPETFSTAVIYSRTARDLMELSEKLMAGLTEFELTRPEITKEQELPKQIISQEEPESSVDVEKETEYVSTGEIIMASGLSPLEILRQAREQKEKPVRKKKENEYSKEFSERVISSPQARRILGLIEEISRESGSQVYTVDQANYMTGMGLADFIRTRNQLTIQPITAGKRNLYTQEMIDKVKEKHKAARNRRKSKTDDPLSQEPQTPTPATPPLVPESMSPQTQEDAGAQGENQTSQFNPQSENGATSETSKPIFSLSEITPEKLEGIIARAQSISHEVGASSWHRLGVILGVEPKIAQMLVYIGYFQMVKRVSFTAFVESNDSDSIDSYVIPKFLGSTQRLFSRDGQNLEEVFLELHKYNYLTFQDEEYDRASEDKMRHRQPSHGGIKL